MNKATLVFITSLFIAGCGQQPPSTSSSGGSSATPLGAQYQAPACPITTVAYSSAHETDPSWHYAVCTPSLGGDPNIELARFSDGTWFYYDTGLSSWIQVNDIEYAECNTVFQRTVAGTIYGGIWNWSVAGGHPSSFTAQVTGFAASNYSCTWF